jgi:menaquinone-dependent protoporphyrinogen oxidase
MMSPILVAYATTYGSTREVAEAVAAALRERGSETELRPASEVDDLAGYSAVVLGAPLYFFRWHKDARRFLARHRRALDALPAAVFALGPTEDKPEDFAEVRKQLDRALAKTPWFSPASVVVFGGRLDPAGLRFPHSNPAMKKMSLMDIRDWEAIRAWADELPTVFGFGKPD